MTIPAELIFSNEFQFRDAFVMPLLIRLGFGVVLNYHGQREFGRDVIFGDVDRFGHVVYYGMQIKYKSSISLSDSHSLVQDAAEATDNPFKHPHSGREEFISCFYVANAGDISEQARDNFFSGVPRRGIRDARLLDGNALLVLDKAASLTRSAHIQERLAGLLQEVRRNRSVADDLLANLKSFADDPTSNPFPILRCRNSAAGAYLSAPFAIPGLSIDTIDQYWETIRIINDVADSVGTLLVNEDYRKERVKGAARFVAEAETRAMLIETSVITLLSELGHRQFR
jgi:hypothetical protein